MIEGKPSETALHTAAARAAHRLHDPLPHLLDDPLASEFLGDEAEDRIAAYRDDGPWVLLENRIFIPLRARVAEDRLRRAYGSGARQYVILGAGLDSFGFRQPQELRDLQIFEVDHPSTQDWKTSRISSLGLEVPPNLRFVPCDFERMSVSTALSGAGFDPEVTSVVCWMGVVYYLGKEVVAAALADLVSVLPRSSEVVLDYMRPWEELPERYHELREMMATHLKRMGEPQVNRYRRDELGKVIRSAGFEDVLHLLREDLSQRYLEPSKCQIPLSERFGLAVAIK